MSINEIQNKLIEIYLTVKVRKMDDVKNNFLIIKWKLEKINDLFLEKESNNLKKIPILELIEYIQNSIDILAELKAEEKYQQKIQIEEEREEYKNNNDQNDINGLKLYENLLIKAEKDIRAHIRVNEKIKIFNI